MLTLKDLNTILDEVAPVARGSTGRATGFPHTDQSGSTGSTGSTPKKQILRATAAAYRVRVTMPDGADPRWLTMLAPGCGPDEARRAAVGTFGAERVLAVERK